MNPSHIRLIALFVVVGMCLVFAVPNYSPQVSEVDDTSFTDSCFTEHMANGQVVLVQLGKADQAVLQGNTGFLAGCYHENANIINISDYYLISESDSGQLVLDIGDRTESSQITMNKGQNFSTRNRYLNRLSQQDELLPLSRYEQMAQHEIGYMTFLERVANAEPMAGLVYVRMPWYDGTGMCADIDTNGLCSCYINGNVNRSFGVVSGHRFQCRLRNNQMRGVRIGDAAQIVVEGALVFDFNVVTLNISSPVELELAVPVFINAPYYHSLTCSESGCERDAQARISAHLQYKRFLQTLIGDPTSSGPGYFLPEYERAESETLPVMLTAFDDYRDLSFSDLLLNDYQASWRDYFNHAGIALHQWHQAGAFVPDEIMLNDINMHVLNHPELEDIPALVSSGASLTLSSSAFVSGLLYSSEELILDTREAPDSLQYVSGGLFTGKRFQLNVDHGNLILLNNVSENYARVHTQQIVVSHHLSTSKLGSAPIHSTQQVETEQQTVGVGSGVDVHQPTRQWVDVIKRYDSSSQGD